MIDTHCHILPGVDDGSDSLQTSLMMAAMAADDGVRTIIATPHVNWEGDNLRTNKPMMQMAHATLVQELQAAHIPLQVPLGAEVLCPAPNGCYVIPGHFPCMAGTRYMLVEFFFEESPGNMNLCLRQLQHMGIAPIIAHPERYTAVQKNDHLPQRWHRAGFYLQVNAGSLSGQFGRGPKKAAQKLMQQQLVHLLASDGHHYLSRRPQLRSQVQPLVRRYGAEYIRLLTKENPRRLLKDLPLQSFGQSSKIP